VQATGSNFTDLAVALWREIRALDQPQLCHVLLRRVAAALAAGYVHQIHGNTPAERMRCLQQLLAQRRIPVSVEELNSHVALTTYACPYPRLAEQDRAVCAMERPLYSELVGCEVELTHCRLDDGEPCPFETREPRSPRSRNGDDYAPLPSSGCAGLHDGSHARQSVDPVRGWLNYLSAVWQRRLR